jgi:hypothetical protein
MKNKNNKYCVDEIWLIANFLLIAHLSKSTEFIFEVEALTSQIQLLPMKGYQENDDHQKIYAVQYDSKLYRWEGGKNSSYSPSLRTVH